MFQENLSHLQPSLFSVVNNLPNAKQKRLEKSREFHFYDIVFGNIDERDFAVLYSDKSSRPNTPVNILVSAILLHNQYNCSISDLINRIEFDLLTRTALGLQDFEETPFCEATYYNFINRVFNHYDETGVNLVETVFDKLTKDQLKKLGIKTSIQRMDSFQALTNIRSYGRTELLIEVLLRLYRTLEADEQLKYQELLAPYLKQTSTKFIYDLNKSDFSKAIKDVAIIFKTLYLELSDDLLVNDEQLNDHPSYLAFKNFTRVYHEHFTVVDEKVEVIDGKDLLSSNLQSPDDIEATYRNKKGVKNVGCVVNVSETADPDNEFQLITDVSTDMNNVNDSTILNDSMSTIMEKTPDLIELHTDGAYGSPDNDDDLKKSGVTQIPTAVKGRKTTVVIKIEESQDPENFTVSCPYQTIESVQTKSRHKACFDNEKCTNCPVKSECHTKEMKQGRVLYFTNQDAEMNKRNRNIETIPKERRNIRPNVEATMKEYTKGFNHKGKLKVRGLFKVSLFAIAMSININFGRIFRYSVV